MPEIVKFYTGEEPILKNVPTWRCREADALSHVLDNLPDLVVKEVNGSGGYGMLVGPHATKGQIEEFRRKLKAHPDNFIAQPTLALSTCPTFVASGRSAASCRSAPLRALRRQGCRDRAGGPDARGAERGLAGGEFQPGRRNQGYLDSRRLTPVRRAALPTPSLTGPFQMLSRTALESLLAFPHIHERADFVARILDATMRLATLPTSYSGERNEWESALAVAGNTGNLPPATMTL